MKDVITALAATWVIVSLVLFATAVVPFVVEAESIVRLAPVCEAKKRGESCVLCGMTTAYLAIGRSDFVAAHEANQGALPLWSASIVNFQAAVAYVLIALRRRRVTGESVCRSSP